MYVNSEAFQRQLMGSICSKAVGKQYLFEVPKSLLLPQDWSGTFCTMYEWRNISKGKA